MIKLQNLANFMAISFIYFHFSDVFFKFMCQSCTSDMKETFEREKLPWYRRFIYKQNKLTSIYKPIGRNNEKNVRVSFQDNDNRSDHLQSIEKVTRFE